MKSAAWKTTFFFVFVAAVVFLFYYISRSTSYPRIPGDADHTGVLRVEDCWRCHSPNGIAPQKAGHPKKSQCSLCHKPSE
jgi:hypothetical protein